MEAFDIIHVPDYLKKKMRKKILWTSLDYHRFNIRDHDILRSVCPTYSRGTDLNNSSSSYDPEQVLLERIYSPRWVAYNIIVSIENCWPVAFAYYEVYWKWQWLQGSLWRIDFKGWFFHFFEFMPEKYRKLYRDLLKAEDERDIRSTRKDIAFDIEIAFPQKCWITPAKNSKRGIKKYDYKWLYNSYGYLSPKNTGYGVRIYNKVVDIEQASKKNKEAWYWWKWNYAQNWTRIEFEFYPPYSLMPTEELMELCAKRIFWDFIIQWGLKYRPCTTFNVENFYKYCERYAKLHWVSIDQLIDQLVAYRIEVINKIEHYSLVEEDKFNDNYLISWQQEE